MKALRPALVSQSSPPLLRIPLAVSRQASTSTIQTSTTLPPLTARRLSPRTPQPRRNYVNHQQTRTFLSQFNPFAASNSSTPLQKISVTRTLPYPSAPLYAIISDVTQYSTFVPFCLSSTVTRWSTAHPDTGNKYPEAAVLTVGWRDIRERFQSRIYCVPGKVVEALSGATRTGLKEEDIAHHDVDHPSEDDGEGPFEELRTTWSVRDKGDSTDVSLRIEYRFANPLYNALSRAAEDRIAEMMIEAFEKRVRVVLGEPKR